MISGIQSAKLKVERAAVHIQAIKDATSEYFGSEPNGIAKQPDGTKRTKFKAAPPPRIAILAGEVIYQLRSALDHLAFELVQLNPNGKRLPARWEKDCEFPLALTIPKDDHAIPYSLPVPYKCFKKSLPGITKSAFAFIESLQPYRGGDGPTQLGLVAKLSNIDKHRHPHIINPQAYHRQHVVTSRYDSLTIVRVEDDAEPEPVPDVLGAPVYVNSGVINPFVSFDKSVLGEGPATLAADDILESCLKVVDAVVIPAFEKLVKNPHIFI